MATAVDPTTGAPLTDAQEEVMRKRVLEMAVTEGIRAAAGAFVISGAAVLAANKYSPWFRRSLGVSGKLGTVMMCALGSFNLVSELALVDSQRHPQEYGFVSTPEQAEQLIKNNMSLEARANLLLKRAANYLYDHPFKMLIGLSVPLIGKIFYDESKKPGLKLSQRVIHTRVQGQMGVVTILALTMGFRDYMSRNWGGRLPE